MAQSNVDNDEMFDLMARKLIKYRLSFDSSYHDYILITTISFKAINDYVLISADLCST